MKLEAVKFEKIIVVGALFGAFAVLFGAFGAHGLKDFLIAHQMLEVYDTAVRYQFYHVFAIFITAFCMNEYQSKILKWAFVLFVVGILMFSGSLYILAITQYKMMGMITPIGGVFLIIGWVCIAASFFRRLNR